MSTLVSDKRRETEVGGCTEADNIIRLLIVMSVTYDPKISDKDKDDLQSVCLHSVASCLLHMRFRKRFVPDLDLNLSLTKAL